MEGEADLEEEDVGFLEEVEADDDGVPDLLPPGLGHRRRHAAGSIPGRVLPSRYLESKGTLQNL